MYQSVLKSLILDSNQNTYNPDKRPPDLSIAEKHVLANRYGLNRVFEGETQRCPCCGLPTYVDTFNICCSRTEFNIDGPGIQHFFDFLVYSMWLLFFQICVSGIYNLYQNYFGDRCSQSKALLINGIECQNTFYNIFALTNRTIVGDVDNISSLLNLISNVLILIMTLAYRRRIKQISLDVDEEVVAVEDFSVLVSELPLDATENEIQQYFTRPLSNHQALIDLKKICLAYNIEDFTQKLLTKDTKQMALTKLLYKNKSDPQCAVLMQQVQNIEKELQMMEGNLRENLKFSGACIISFNEERVAKETLNQYKLRPLQRIFYYIQKILNKQQKKRHFRGKLFKVQRAPTPGDVLWENMGTTEYERFKRQIIGSIASSLVLVICFGIILGVSILQHNISKNKYEESQLRYFVQNILGLFISFVVAFLNNVLGIIVRMFVKKEKHLTITSFHMSVAKTLGVAQFLNTAIITLLVRFISSDNDQSLLVSCWIQGGLNSSISLIMLTNIILPPILQIMDPYYIYRKYRRNQIISEGSSCNYTQKQAHGFFLGVTMDPAQRYAQTTKTLLLTFFYAYLLPLGLLYGLVAIGIQFWVEKYLLLYRYYKPAPLNQHLADEMIQFYIELTMSMFASGCAIWEKTVYGELHEITIAQLIVAVSYFVLPMDLIFGCLLHTHREDDHQTYDQARKTFWDDYDRRNPATMKGAIEEWLKSQDNQELVSKFMLKNQRKYYQKQNQISDEKVVPNPIKMAQSVLYATPQRIPEETDNLVPEDMLKGKIVGRKINKVNPQNE